MSEKVLGVVEGVKAGRPARNWTLLVTEDRIIAAPVGRAGLGAAFEFGGILMAKARVKGRAEKLRHLSPESVLAAHKKNFSIPHSQVQSAEMDDPSVVAAGRLLIQTAVEEHEFRLTDEEHYQEHADLLRSVLKDKLHFH